MKKKILWLMGFFLVSIIVFSYYLSYRENILQTKVQEQKVAIQNKGYPCNGQELQAWHRQIPPEHNAAMIYNQAFDSNINYLSEFAEEGPVPAFIIQAIEDNRDLSPKQRNFVVSYLSKNKATIDLLEMTSNYSNARFVDFNTPLDTLELSHIFKMTHLSDLLLIKTFSELENQQYQSALNSIVLHIKLGKFLCEESTIASFSTFEGIQSRILFSLQRFFRVYSPSAQETKNHQRNTGSI